MKTVIKLSALLVIISGCLSELSAQCTFTGLAPSYCRNDPAANLTANGSGGYFFGPGVVGSSFSPTLAGAGTHTISYGVCSPSYQVTQGTYAPISTTASSSNGVSLTDDQTSGSLPIGFNFRFFCNSYSNFYLCSNGWLSFTQTNLSTYPGQFMPTGTTPDNMIAFCWTDLYPPGGGTISYTTVGVQPNRILLIDYVNINHFSSGNPVTLQVQLYENTNVIEIHTTSMPSNGNNHTMGIQNTGATTAFVVPGRNATTNWSATNEMYRFTPIFTCLSSQTVNVDGTVLSVAGASSLCLHSSTTFTASGTTTYSWSNNTTGPFLTVTPAAGLNTYTVTGQAPNVNCVYSTPFSLTVYSTPVGATSSTTLLCVGSTATLTGNGASTYTWSTGPSGITTTIDPIANSTFTVYGTSALGCVEQYTFEQAVNTNTLSISSDTAVCLGHGVTLSAGNANSFMWSTGSPFAVINVTPTAMTIYSVAAIDEFNCPLEAFVTVSVNPIPNVTVNTPKNKVCKGELVTFTAGGATTYTWTSPPYGSGKTLTVIPTVDVPYTFSVQGIDANGCRDEASITITVDRCTGIADHDLRPAFDIYPNPATGSVFIKMGDEKGQYTAEVLNSLGALVHTADMSQDLNEIDLSTLAKGIYLIRISNNGHSIQISRLIKE